MEGVPSPTVYPPVFIDTNLDTHLAVIFSPEDTVAGFKKKVCLEHVSCFPDIGDVTVQSIKVRRKAMYYHLSDSMLVRTAFDGIKGTWFLQMDMSHIATDGTLTRCNGNKREDGVTGGPACVNVPVNADSIIKKNDQSLPEDDIFGGEHMQNKINSHHTRKKMRKDELSISEFGKTEVIHSIGKQTNGDIPKENPEHDPKCVDPKCVAKELNKGNICEETSPPKNSVEIVPKCLPGDGIISNNNKKSPHKTGSSKVKSSKNGASSLEFKNEEASVVPGNFIEGDSLIPYTNKRSTSSKKRSIKAKESSENASHEVVPPTERPPCLERQSVAIKRDDVSDERAASDASIRAKATQEGQEELANSEGRHTKRSRKRKIQEVDTANHSLVELSKSLSLKQKSKLDKQIAPENPQVVHSDKGNGDPALLCIGIFPDLQVSKNLQDHQVAEIHNRDISNDNEFKKPKQGTEKKGTVDKLGAKSRSVQQKVSGDNDSSVKQVNANQSKSDDSAEEDTHFNEKLYHVAMRKNVPKSRPKMELNQLKQKASPNAKDNIFGHIADSSSEDKVERHIGKDANENATNDSTSDDSEYLEQTQVVLGPKALKGTSSQGHQKQMTMLNLAYY